MKKPAPGKRASPPRRFEYGSQFRKDWVRLSDSGRYDMALLTDVMMLLIANRGPLPAQYKDHALVGNWKGARDCHVRGDFLLIYRLDEETDMIHFVRTGSHADLFK